MKKKEEPLFMFVYGTLMKGLSNHYLLGEDAELVGEASVPGILYSLGGYPGARFGASSRMVRGEVYKINPRRLPDIDRLEGFDANPRNRPYNHYNRVTVVPLFRTMPTEPVETVWAYDFNSDVSLRPIVEDGSWRKELAKRRR